MKNLTCLFLLAFMLPGCAAIRAIDKAAITPYQPTGMRGGYEDKKLDEGRYHVEFGGNGTVSQQMAIDLAMLRGAELCRDAGYAYMKTSSRQMEVTMLRGGGVYANQPTAKFDVECSHAPTPDAITISDYIAKTLAAYPDIRFPYGHQ